jgi:predicted DNA-binding protein
MAQFPIRYPISLPPRLYDRMKVAAHGKDMSMAAWIRGAIRQRLEREEAAVLAEDS